MILSNFVEKELRNRTTEFLLPTLTTNQSGSLCFKLEGTFDTQDHVSVRVSERIYTKLARGS